MTHRRLWLRTAIILTLGLSCVGCAVGPTYHPPDPPSVTRYAAAPIPDQTVATDVVGGEAQHFVSRDIPADW